MKVPSASKDVQQLELSYTAGGSDNGIATLENSLTVSYKVKHIPPSDPVIPLLGIYPRDVKT